MSEVPITNQEHDATDAEREVAVLLRLAGRRPDPSAERLMRLRSAAYSEWTAVIDRRRRNRWTAAIAAAAAVIAFAVWSVRLASPIHQSEVVVARVVRATGDITSMLPNGQVAVLSADQTVLAGTVLETNASSRAGLQLLNGNSIRLDRSTRVAVHSRNAVSLHRGALYVDDGSAGEHAGPSSDAAAVDGFIEIRTRLGDVRDVGTRFEVRLDAADVLSVRVRDGEIFVSGNSSPLHARAGEGLAISSGQPPRRFAVPVHGETWGWISDVAPPFALEGRTLPEFLDWVAREQGWRWRFLDEHVERRGHSIRLHGSAHALTPHQALGVVLPSTAMTFELINGELLIKPLEDVR